MPGVVGVVTAVIVGVATWYGPGFVGEPLYCDSRPAVGGAGLRYGSEVEHPWIAADVSLYGRGWQCGDVVWLEFETVGKVEYRLLDAGPLNRYCVVNQPEEGECGTIVADVSGLYWPLSKHTLSAPVRMVNVSLLHRVADQQGLVP